MDETNQEAFSKREGVNEPSPKILYETNEILKRFIYIQHRSNINRFAKELGVNRQFIWGIIAGRLRPSMPMARKICDVLKVEDMRLIFPDGSLEYPRIISADKIQGEEVSHDDAELPANTINGGENE